MATGDKIVLHEGAVLVHFGSPVGTQYTAPTTTIEDIVEEDA
jgi:hypothetical protein